jgi:hypothetical protein
VRIVTSRMVRCSLYLYSIKSSNSDVDNNQHHTIHEMTCCINVSVITFSNLHSHQKGSNASCVQNIRIISNSSSIYIVELKFASIIIIKNSSGNSVMLLNSHIKYSTARSTVTKIR